MIEELQTESFRNAILEGVSLNSFATDSMEIWSPSLNCNFSSWDYIGPAKLATFISTCPSKCLNFFVNLQVRQLAATTKSLDMDLIAIGSGTLSLLIRRGFDFL